jgi:hypothetical protein
MLLYDPFFENIIITIIILVVLGIELRLLHLLGLQLFLL